MRRQALSEPTQPPTCANCPLYGVGKGFVLGSGDPAKAKYAVILEAPGREEISFQLRPNPNRAFLQTTGECEKEVALRRRDYPGMEERWLRTGVPAVGATGMALQFWIWQKLGIRREEVYVDNVLRCLPPKQKSGEAYPTGDVRKEAERCCRQYDRIGTFRPDTAIVSLHPAGLLREITPLPLAVKDFEKVRDFTAQGRRVVALLGGKAASAYLRYASNVTKWRGHWVELCSNWSETYRALFEFSKKRRKKVTEDEELGEYFAVPKETLKKARVKAEPKDGTCGKKHRKEPKCGYVGCIKIWEEAHGVQV